MTVIDEGTSAAAAASNSSFENPDDEREGEDEIEATLDLPAHKTREWAKVLADTLRTSALSSEYYIAVLRRETLTNTILEAVVAIFTTGTIGAWALWESGVGSYVWQIGIGAVALVNVLKPLLKLGPRIEKHSKLASAYHELAVDTKVVCKRLHLDDGFTTKTLAATSELMERLARLEKQDDVGPKPAQLVPIQRRIHTQYPRKFFWPPPGHPAEDGEEGARGHEKD